MVHATPVSNLRLLALHGRYQNAQNFGRKLKTTGGSLSSHKLEFVDAPNVSQPQVSLRGARLKPRLASSASLQDSYRVWWETDSTSGELSGFEESLHHIKATISQLTSNGEPLDGVLGFSQGAAFAALLCTPEISAKIGWEPNVAVLCSGYLSDVPEHKMILSYGGFLAHTESFHAFGSVDHKVPAHKSVELADAMRGEQYKHPKGHAPPCSHTKDCIGKWLDSRTRNGHTQQSSDTGTSPSAAFVA